MQDKNTKMYPKVGNRKTHRATPTEVVSIPESLLNDGTRDISILLDLTNKNITNFIYTMSDKWGISPEKALQRIIKEGIRAYMFISGFEKENK